ncbi:17883_t:CDS:1, partial [Gigaspora margarita]
SIQKVDDMDSYLLVNGEEIRLKNVFQNPERPEQCTTNGGVQLELVLNKSGGRGFQESAGGG